MKWLKRILVFLLTLSALLVIVSQFLPGSFRVERSIVIKAPAEKYSRTSWIFASGNPGVSGLNATRGWS